MAKRIYSSALFSAPDVQEKDVLRLILDYLSAKGIQAWRNNTGAALYPAAELGTNRWVRFGRRGQSDITGICSATRNGFRIDGLRLDIEVKRKGKKPSAEQEAFLADMRMRGGIAIWADSIDMLEEKFSEEGLI